MSANVESIKTVGELRKFLAARMVEVRDGKLDVEKASRIVKIAGQINENFYAECKVNRVRVEAGETIAKLGELSIE